MAGKGFKRLVRSTVVWAIACGISLIFLAIGSHAPSFIDQVYHRFLFRGIRLAYDYTLGLLPFPPVYLLFALLIWWLTRYFRNLRKGAGWQTALLKPVRFILAAVTMFYITWGFNYKQTPVEDQLQLGLGHIEAPDIRGEFETTTRELGEIFGEMYALHWTIDSLLSPKFRESEVRSLVKNKLLALGLPAAGKVRGRMLSPTGTLLVWNTAGIYIPFVGEGHIDKGLLPFQYPYVMAHEMTHGYGIADEGSCNFVAYLACRDAENVYVRLSGVLGYWRYIASEYRRIDPDAYAAAYEKLPPLLKASLQAIFENNRRFPEFLPTFRYHAYDQYLKAHGIKEGMQNYARVVRLVYAWRKKTGQ